MIPTFANHPLLAIVAGADPRPEARDRFAQDFAAKAYATVEELCEDPSLTAVYIATPHQFHVAHVCAAAARGLHILVEKPMALSVADCQKMIKATRSAGVHLMVGHSYSFDGPIQRAREIIDGGTVGNVRMMTAVNFTDFLYRPRRPEELLTDVGGGVLFNQAPHHIDVVRFLGGGRVRSVRAAVGAWDAKRPTEGSYSALLTFEDGAVAAVTYSGYAHFDSDEFCGWIAESGLPKGPTHYGATRRILAQAASGEAELQLKRAQNYGGVDYVGPTVSGDGAGRYHQHFGLLIVSCERADLRPLPQGVMIYDDASARLDALPAPIAPRQAVVAEFYDAAVHNRPPVHSGEWGLATMEVCLAMLRSAREHREIALEHQIGLPSKD